MTVGEYGDGHMNDLDIAAYIDRGLKPERRAQIEEHLADCGECRENLVKAEELVGKSRRPQLIGRYVALLAAAAVMIVAVPSIRSRPTSERPAVTRDDNDSARLIAYGPVGEVKSPGVVAFTWASAPDALSYRITVTTAGGADVWSTSLTDTSVVLPESIRLGSRTEYLWVVDALLKDGSTRSTGIHRFGIVP